MNDIPFTHKLSKLSKQQDSSLCIGFDPDILKLPVSMRGKADAIFAFCKEIVDATADLVCAYKPQIAYFSANRAENQLELLIQHIHRNHPQIPVILDAKRGDIGSTAEQYAVEAFDRYQADAVTVNPYMGFDSIEPYLKYANKGVFVLCRTSNPGGSDLQFLPLKSDTQVLGKDELLFERVASLAAGAWNLHGQLGLVVGATFPEEIARVRQIVGANMPLLIPGIGAQGGDIEKTIQAGGGEQLVINSSRQILYASSESDFAEAARRVAIHTRDAIRQAQKNLKDKD
jgi:orotidine-5'-phosphate decarboxylase